MYKSVNASALINERAAEHAISLGGTYGDFTVLRDLGINKSRHHYYECVCRICNTVLKVSKATLLSKNPHCVCHFRGNDYTGQIVNGYKVIYRTDKRNSGRNVIWRCKCLKCGKERDVASNVIGYRKIPKCSCQRKIERSEKQKICSIFP